MTPSPWTLTALALVAGLALASCAALWRLKQGAPSEPQRWAPRACSSSYAPLLPDGSRVVDRVSLMVAAVHAGSSQLAQ